MIQVGAIYNWPCCWDRGCKVPFWSVKVTEVPENNRLHKGKIKVLILSKCPCATNSVIGETVLLDSYHSIFYTRPVRGYKLK